MTLMGSDPDSTALCLQGLFVGHFCASLVPIDVIDWILNSSWAGGKSMSHGYALESQLEMSVEVN